MSAQQLLIDEDKLGASVVGQALFAGRLVATLQSKLTGSHVTVQFQCKAKVVERWRTMPLNLASHVFIDVPDNDKVGTVYPPGSPNRWAGHFWPDRNADPARVWAALKLIAIAQGDAPPETGQYLLRVATHCLRCGRELTEPESIQALMGPVCRRTVSEEYGKRHQAKRKAAGERIIAQGPALPIKVEPGSDLAELVAEWERGA